MCLIHLDSPGWNPMNEISSYTLNLSEEKCSWLDPYSFVSVPCTVDQRLAVSKTFSRKCSLAGSYIVVVLFVVL
jgi:hypothetical protein